MNALAFVLCFLISAGSIAQSYLEISGTVRNAKSLEPIPYASVHVKNTGIGTAANAEGKFMLHVNTELRDSLLVLSCLGFDKREFMISKVFNLSGADFYLTESAQLLQTVEITPLNARRIMENVVGSIKDNYSSDPHRLDAFYRTTIQDNNNFTRLLEAAVYINDAKGTLFGYRDIFIRQIRKSNDLRQDKLKTIDGYLTHLVRNHPLQAGHWDFLRKNKLDEFNIDIERTVTQDSELFYVISMKAKKPTPRIQYDVELIVNEKNFAIVDITIFWKPELGDYYTWAFEPRDSSKFMADWQESRYTYQPYEGRYYLHSSRWHRKGKVINKSDGKTLFRTESMDELLVTNIEKGKFENKNQFFGTTDVYLIADRIPYDESFWKTYNRPVDSDHFRKAKREMEKQESLDQQFRKYTGTSLAEAQPSAKKKGKRPD